MLSQVTATVRYYVGHWVYIFLLVFTKYHCVDVANYLQLNLSKTEILLYYSS